MLTICHRSIFQLSCYLQLDEPASLSEVRNRKGTESCLVTLRGFHVANNVVVKHTPYPFLCDFPHMTLRSRVSSYLKS